MSTASSLSALNLLVVALKGVISFSAMLGALVLLGAGSLLGD